MKRFSFENIVIWFLVSIIIFIFAVVILAAVALALDDRECAIFSEPRTRRGFIMAGKAMVPTTYTSRDCLVWKEKP